MMIYDLKKNVNYKRAFTRVRAYMFSINSV